MTARAVLAAAVSFTLGAYLGATAAFRIRDAQRLAAHVNAALDPDRIVAGWSAVLDGIEQALDRDDTP